MGEIARRNPDLESLINSARQIQGDGTAAYLTMMGVRLLELHRVLKNTGSIYLHCDPTASHYLKICLDAVFGKANFRNELIWGYTGPGSPKMRQFNRKHDAIFWYAKGDKWTFNADAVRLPHKDSGPHTGGFASEKTPLDKELSKVYAASGKVPETWWTDIALAVRSSKERTGWATQKPLKLLRRIIKASSNPGDLVLDPFAGCATACVAAEIEGRQCIGIEACESATDIIQVRLDEAGLGSLGTQDGILHKVTIRRDIPKRTDEEGIALARKRKTKAYKTEENFDHLYGKQRGHCVGCTNHFQSENLTFDHKTPQVKGGGHELDNLQLLCNTCNSIKGDDKMEDLKRRLKKRDEYNLAKLERMGMSASL